MEQHTPGPWKVREIYDDLILVSRGIEGPDGRGLNKGEEIECFAAADARLMAAAPDLLAALKEFVDDTEARWDMSARSTNPGIKHCVEQAKAAIAKAEGV